MSEVKSFMIAFHAEAREQAVEIVARLADVEKANVISSRAFEKGIDMSYLKQGYIIVCENLSIILLETSVDVAAKIKAMIKTNPAILAIDSAGIMPMLMNVPAEAITDNDDADMTWGLKRANVDRSPYSGRGVKIAILDTGFDFSHPDFVNRNVRVGGGNNGSFISSISSARDDNGHGTHCAGIACGSKSPSTGKRYGVAHNAEIVICKVADNSGVSIAGAIAAIDWAISDGCHIVSLSLGTLPTTFDFYKRVGEKAMAQGTLLIAAAGNDSNRVANSYKSLCSPADSPYVMAVGSVDAALKIANTSNRGTSVTHSNDTIPDTGVDIAGPGVNIRSSWPTYLDNGQPNLPKGIKRLSGTSQATPFVAGIAALWSEAAFGSVRQPNASSLWLRVTSNVRNLPYPAMDVGKGLVLAPSRRP